MAKRAYRVVGTKGEFESIPNLENELYDIDEAFTSLKKAKAYADKMTVYFNKTYNLKLLVNSFTDESKEFDICQKDYNFETNYS
jgi:hypothetical protein